MRPKSDVGRSASAAAEAPANIRTSDFGRPCVSRHGRGQPPLRRGPSESIFAAASPPALRRSGRPRSIAAHRLRAAHVVFEVLQPSAVVTRAGWRPMPGLAAAPGAARRGANDDGRLALEISSRAAKTGCPDVCRRLLAPDADRPTSSFGRIGLTANQRPGASTLMMLLRRRFTSRWGHVRKVGRGAADGGRGGASDQPHPGARAAPHGRLGRRGTWCSRCPPSRPCNCDVQGWRTR